MLKNRIGYGIFLVISMTLCYIYQNSITSLFAYVLLFLPIVSFFYMLGIYVKLTYTQSIDKEVFIKGESIRFLLSIHNESRWVCPQVELEFYGEDSILRPYFEKKCINIGGRATRTYEFEVPCTYRGHYEVGVKQIYIKDFLGLFRIACKVMQPNIVTVYPRVVPIHMLPLLKQDGQNLDKERELPKAGGNVFSGIRAYVYGDSMKQVHWKMSAKKQELLMKEKQGISVSTTYIFLDLAKHTNQVVTNTILEDKLIECIIAISYYYTQNGMPIQIVYHTQNFMTVKAEEEKDFHMLYEELSKVKFESKIQMEDVLALSLMQGMIRGNQLIITSKITYGLYEQIDTLVREGDYVLVVYISPYQTQEKEPKMCQNILQAFNNIAVNYIYVGFEDELEKVL